MTFQMLKKKKKPPFSLILIYGIKTNWQLKKYFTTRKSLSLSNWFRNVAISVGAAVTIVGLAAYRVYLARKNSSS